MVARAVIASYVIKISIKPCGNNDWGRKHQSKSVTKFRCSPLFHFDVGSTLHDPNEYIHSICKPKDQKSTPCAKDIIFAASRHQRDLACRGNPSAFVLHCTFVFLKFVKPPSFPYASSRSEHPFALFLTPSDFSLRPRPSLQTILIWRPRNLQLMRSLPRIPQKV